MRPLAAPPRCAALLLVLGLAVQNVGLAALRFRQTLRDATPVERNLLGLRRACAWLRVNAGPESPPVVVSALPAVVSFLSGYVASAPAYAPDGTWKAAGATWVVLSGPLRDFPAYREEAENRLAAAVAEAAAPPRFSFGDAAVYKLSPP